TRPTDFRRETASRTTVRLTENCSASSGSVGSLSPGRSRPARISPDKASATRSDRRALGAIAGKFGGADIICLPKFILRLYRMNRTLPKHLLASLEHWGPRWHEVITAGRDAM